MLRDRVVNLSVGFGYLVVTTSLQCCIYSLQNLNTPHIFDLKETVNYVQLSDKNMLMVDGNGMQVCITARRLHYRLPRPTPATPVNPLVSRQVYSYEGRVIAAPKFQGMRPESINGSTVSMSSDCLAIIDHQAYIFACPCLSVFMLLSVLPSTPRHIHVSPCVESVSLSGMRRAHAKCAALSRRTATCRGVLSCGPLTLAVASSGPQDGKDIRRGVWQGARQAHHAHT